MDLLRSLGEKAAVASKTILREAEIMLGKMVAPKVKARAKMRAATANRIVELRRQDGVTPFPSVRSRVALKRVKTSPGKPLQGER